MVRWAITVGLALAAAALWAAQLRHVAAALDAQPPPARTLRGAPTGCAGPAIVEEDAALRVCDGALVRFDLAAGEAYPVATAEAIRAAVRRPDGGLEVVSGPPDLIGAAWDAGGLATLTASAAPPPPEDDEPGRWEPILATRAAGGWAVTYRRRGHGLGDALARALLVVAPDGAPSRTMAPLPHPFPIEASSAGLIEAGEIDATRLVSAVGWRAVPPPAPRYRRATFDYRFDGDRLIALPRFRDRGAVRLARPDGDGWLSIERVMVDRRSWLALGDGDGARGGPVVRWDRLDGGAILVPSSRGGLWLLGDGAYVRVEELARADGGGGLDRLRGHGGAALPIVLFGFPLAAVAAAIAAALTRRQGPHLGVRMAMGVYLVLAVALFNAAWDAAALL